MRGVVGTAHDADRFRLCCIVFEHSFTKAWHPQSDQHAMRCEAVCHAMRPYSSAWLLCFTLRSLIGAESRTHPNTPLSETLGTAASRRRPIATPAERTATGTRRHVKGLRRLPSKWVQISTKRCMSTSVRGPDSAVSWLVLMSHLLVAQQCLARLRRYASILKDSEGLGSSENYWNVPRNHLYER